MKNWENEILLGIWATSQNQNEIHIPKNRVLAQIEKLTKHKLTERQQRQAVDKIEVMLGPGFYAIPGYFIIHRDLFLKELREGYPSVYEIIKKG